jgi:F-type H+-transporting ATPase subunit b
MPQFDASTYASQLFWLLVSLGILFIAFWKIIIPKMSAKLSERESKLKKILAEAQQLDTQADKIILDYNQKLQDLKRSQKEKLQNVSSFIHKSKEDLEAGLKQSIENTLDKYQVSLNNAKKELLQRLPEGLALSLSDFINQQMASKVSNPDEIKPILIKEIKKVEYD